MRTSNFTMLLPAAFLISALLISPEGSTAETGLVIVANKSVVTEKITPQEIKSIFLGQLVRWPDNSQIHVATLSREDIHEAFVKAFTQKTPSQFQRWWREMLFTGKGTLPKSFNSEDKLIGYVSETEGAIGYVSLKPNSKNVKIITIDK